MVEKTGYRNIGIKTGTNIYLAKKKKTESTFIFWKYQYFLVSRKFRYYQKNVSTSKKISVLLKKCRYFDLIRIPKLWLRKNIGIFRFSVLFSLSEAILGLFIQLNIGAGLTNPADGFNL